MENEDKFLKLFNELKNRDLVLPDFQRKFVWDKDMMCKLYASVLCRMPLSSILILKSSDEKFACKELGAKRRTDEYNNSIPVGKELSYLIDGQQRLTSLFAGFSTYFLESYSDKKNNIAKDILLNMYFLKIPSNLNPEADDLDIFNIKNLDFNSSLYKGNKYFSSSKVQRLISSFKVSDIVKLQKNENFDIRKEEHLKQIISYCCNEDKEYFYHIPLQFICSEDRTIRRAFNKIIKVIAANFIKDPLFNEATDDQDAWVSDVIGYLKFCLSNISLEKLVVENSDKGRAIDIYSNLNIGGVSLSVFDLIMAKVGSVDKENFYDKLVGYIQNDNSDGYPSELYKNSDDAELLSKNYKNASELAGALSNDGDISKSYINVFLNVLSMYITQKNRNKEKAFDVNCIKQENILELDAVKIKDNAELVCRAIDRALFFFQTRCGVRTIADINYQAQLAVIAYFFTDDSIFNNKKSLMLFEYWYWISIFAYLYPSSQNIKIFEEVPKFEAYFYGENNKDILNYLYKFQSDVLNKSDYSDEMTLKMKNSKKYPLPVITKYICQYYLSIGYKDFCTEKKLDFLYEGEFDIHHIMPLGSSPEYKDQRLKIGESTRKLRSKKDNPYNSPLNMIYITKESNKLISNMDYEDYSQNSHVKMVLPSVDCPSVISSGFSLDDFLSQRFNGLKTKLTSRLDELYICLNK